jgi:hypothetical protein
MIGVMPATLSFAGKPTITGERVLLRPVDPADAAGLAAIDDEALRLTGTQRTASLDELRDWYATRAGHTDRLDLSIIDRAGGRWAGEVVLNDLDEANRSCGFEPGLARKLAIRRSREGPCQDDRRGPSRFTFRGTSGPATARRSRRAPSPATWRH